MKSQSSKNLTFVLIGLSCLLFIIAIILILHTNRFTFRNQTANKENNQNQVIEEDSSLETENNSDESIPNFITDDGSDIEKNDVDTSGNIAGEGTEDSNSHSAEAPSPSPEEPMPKSEANVISYFEAQNNMISANMNPEDSTLREKIKNAFVTVVDFIFYDKEIAGYTFQELTTAAKLKVIHLALTMDHKIDEYFPNYKDIIKDKYTSIKGKLAVKYLEFTSFLCDSVGEATCNQAKEDFNAMKESFGFTWDLIKELASSGSNKIKEFYESWRDSE